MMNLAKRLMDHEALENKFSEATPAAAFQADDRLRPHLATLMGVNGFRALLLRSLALSNPEVPWLRAVQVEADGAFEGFEALHAEIEPAEFLRGKVVLLAQLLGLLVALIGPNLTQHLVGETWPKIVFTEVDFGNGGKK
jgi:hypothetical protein